MKFTEHTLAYSIGEGEEVSHEIDKIDMEQAGGGTIKAMHTTTERRNPKLRILRTGALPIRAQVPRRFNLSLTRY